MALTMDVFKPENPNGIGVILLISSGWASSHDRIDIEWIDRIKKLLSYDETVFAVVHSSMSRYKIPDIRKDIARAVRFVRFHAKEFDVSPERLGIVGHSSGRHLSLLVAIINRQQLKSSEGEFILELVNSFELSPKLSEMLLNTARECLLRDHSLKKGQNT
ncbi:MAG: alpha/beta hydrolase [Ignavibacteriaceae bacterium]